MAFAVTFSEVIERGFRAAILIVFVEGIRRRDPGAIANAIPAFGATYLPDLLERRYAVAFRPWQRAYLDLAVFAHAAGMLGPYDDREWWDTITHTLSATILGGFVHVAARRRGREPGTPIAVSVAVLGVLWELLEYAVHAASDRLGVEPLLVPYSARDTLGDIACNLLGALLVIAFGDRALDNLTDPEG